MSIQFKKCTFQNKNSINNKNNISAGSNDTEFFKRLWNINNRNKSKMDSGIIIS